MNETRNGRGVAGDQPRNAPNHQDENLDNPIVPHLDDQHKGQFPVRALYLHGAVAYSATAQPGNLYHDDATGCVVLPVVSLVVEHYQPGLVQFTVGGGSERVRRVWSGDYSFTMEVSDGGR